MSSSATSRPGALPLPRRLVLLGSVLVDLSLQVPHLPPRGGDVVARPSAPTAGGGFNVLSAAARLGLPAVYAGRIGGGPFGAVVRSALEAEGIELAFPEPAVADTGYCVVLVEPDGERTFLTAPGAEAELTAADLAGLRLRDGDAVYVSGYDLGYPVNGPVLGEYLAGLPAGRLLVVDPGPLVGDIPRSRWAAVLGRTDLLSLNAREAALLWGADPSGPARPGPPMVVVRQGAAGAMLYRAGAPPHLVPVVPAAAVDTTGAGDVHVAALLAGLATGKDLPDAVTYANRAAAYSVTRRGPATGPTPAQLAAVPAR
jgi:sugar/nucleoside kinase (ribokinase family)